MIEDSELPPGWHDVTLEDVAVFNPGVDKSQFKADDEVPFVPMPAVEAQNGRIDVSERRSFSKVKNGFTCFETGDVLFAKITPCMENGKMAVVPPLPRGVGFGTTEFHVLRPIGAIDKDFLYYFVSSSALRHEAQHHMTGAVGQKRVPKRFLETKRLRLPPLAEQQRIVEKIETLFAELDKGEEALRAVQKLLARYRQSVLKAAVTGTLTADWRTANPPTETGQDLLVRILKERRRSWQGRGKYIEPVEPETESLPELPEGWVWASVEQLATVMGGLTKNKTRGDMPLKRPMLRVANVYQDRLELDDVHETGITAGELERVALRKHDMLVVEGNGSKDQIGRMAVWNCEVAEAVHQNHLIKVRMVDPATVAFAMKWFRSPQGRQNIELVASSTSGLYTLSISKIERLVVPLPPMAELLELCERLDEAFARMAPLHDWCETELKRSAALRQSILKDAFSGKLVPQDPSDEPAAKLLERISAGASAPATGKRRKAAA